MAKILIVDDDPDIQLMLDATLSTAGYEVVACDRPRQVTELIDQNAFEAMILDLSMPELSGFEVLADLQARNNCPPTLILSASHGRDDRVRGLRGGAEDFLAKPFDPEELVLRVERLIASSNRPGEISSDLVTYPCWDLLQMLERSQQTGRLSVNLPGATFEGDFQSGWPLRAKLGHLSGDEALVALLGHHEGSFRFSSRTPIPQRQEGEPRLTSAQDLLLQTAWLNDELQRLQGFLPSSDRALSLGLPPEPKALERLDAVVASEVLDFVSSHPGCNLKTLCEMLPVAPRRLEMTVGKLIERELLVADAPTSETEVGDAHGSAARVDSVVERLLEDRKSGVFQMLTMAQPQAWPQLRELLEELPGTYAGGQWDDFLRNLERVQGGSCKLPGTDGHLHLHVQVLSGATGAKATKILPVCHGVVIWLGDDDELEDVEPLIDKVERSPRELRGQLIAEGNEMAQRLELLVAGCKRWKVARLAPKRLSRLLELMR